MKIINRKKSKGFALLYTIIVISLILTIALSISNITYKQTVLSSLARDSQIAFFQADSGVECGLIYDVVSHSPFARPSLLADVKTNTPEITCGKDTLTLQESESRDDYFVYRNEVATTEPCYAVVFDKESDPVQATVSSSGYNTCQSSPRRVERALKATY